ncbi:MAG: hypothetical protein ACR2PC_05630 [Tsuneonella suprasediminis]|uniref:Uncharacterized protein n=1 Tax=Tsuneonella suprasediminis TaxID=2306996 RepID=A0A419QYV1_9SPHN|nr:hypothetical protein [Tsuneonella suprasediminis]RJX65992.1 hypothetical protein D6858_13545 [Tsuneonella suprasediminis]UBS32632.1 hypothetical protein LBX01_14345 [Altererythrobacter sp. N1]
MGLFDSILGHATNHPTVTNMAEKLGIDPALAAKAVAALGEAHQMEGDTVELASAKTGLSTDIMSQIKDAIGGEGSLTEFANIIDRDGDGNPLNDIADMASKFFGKK